MMRICFLILFLLFAQQMMAQFSNSVWCFGDSCGINWTNSTSPTLFTSNVKTRGGSVSILDTISGAFVYANSQTGTVTPNTRVWNKYHMLMQNGSGISGSGWYHEFQLLPYPNNDSLLVLFSVGVTGSTPFGLYYSIINYKTNNDSGLVVQKNSMLNTLPAVDALSAVKHGNGRDWWIVFQHWDNLNVTPNNDFYVYLLSPIGISGPNIQSIGSLHRTNLGCLRFNGEGDQFANVNISDFVELYDFDRCTGLVTGSIPIEPELTSPPYNEFYGSCEFSLDGSKLYIPGSLNGLNGVSNLYQYDLLASNILNSKTVIYSFYPDTTKPFDIKRATDGKIYLAAAYLGPGATYPYADTLYNQYNNNLSVITQPDSLGAACNFQPFSFNLGIGRTYYGLPNNPDYELGPLVGSPCDTITAIKEIKAEPAFFQAWFKNDWSTLFVNAKQIKGHNAQVRIFDSTGRLIKEQKGQVYSGYFTADVVLENLAKGVYVVQLLTEKEKLSTKFIY